MSRDPAGPTERAWGPSWRDHQDRSATAPEVPGAEAPAFYLPIGEHQGDSYRRNAFAVGTAEELATLRALTGVAEGNRVLDVGCGDGRHLRALAAELPAVRGVGIDVSPALVAAGRRAAAQAGVEVELVVADAREAEPMRTREPFDVAWSLHQGVIGTSPATDRTVLANLAEAVRPGGLVVVTFFHALFAARHLAPGDAFDTIGLVHHQRAEVRGRDEARATFDLWTSSYTAREAVQVVEGAGLEVLSLRGVEPGAYGRRAAGELALDDPELLVLARR